MSEYSVIVHSLQFCLDKYLSICQYFAKRHIYSTGSENTNFNLQPKIIHKFTTFFTKRFFAFQHYVFPNSIKYRSLLINKYLNLFQCNIELQKIFWDKITEELISVITIAMNETDSKSEECLKFVMSAATKLSELSLTKDDQNCLKVQYLFLEYVAIMIHIANIKCSVTVVKLLCTFLTQMSSFELVPLLYYTGCLHAVFAGISSIYYHYRQLQYNDSENQFKPAIILDSKVLSNFKKISIPKLNLKNCKVSLTGYGILHWTENNLQITSPESEFSKIIEQRCLAFNSNQSDGKNCQVNESNDFSWESITNNDGLKSQIQVFFENSLVTVADMLDSMLPVGIIFLEYLTKQQIHDLVFNKIYERSSPKLQSDSKYKALCSSVSQSFLWVSKLIRQSFNGPFSLIYSLMNTDVYKKHNKSITSIKIMNKQFSRYLDAIINSSPLKFELLKKIGVGSTYTVHKTTFPKYVSKMTLVPTSNEIDQIFDLNGKFPEKVPTIFSKIILELLYMSCCRKITPLLFDLKRSNDEVHLIIERYPYTLGQFIQMEYKNILHHSEMKDNKLFGLIFLNKIIQIQIRLINLVQYLHSKGILHNDIRVDNIVTDKTLENIKLIDFSESAHISQMPLSISKAISEFGFQCQPKFKYISFNGPSDIYTSPEYLECLKPSFSHDDWCLSQIFFFLYTGRTIREINFSIPGAYKELEHYMNFESINYTTNISSMLRSSYYTRIHSKFLSKMIQGFIGNNDLSKSITTLLNQIFFSLFKMNVEQRMPMVLVRKQLKKLNEFVELYLHT